MKFLGILSICALLFQRSTALATPNPYLPQSIIDVDKTPPSYNIEGGLGNPEGPHHPYQAKLHCSSTATSIIPGEYIVTLTLGHSLLQHETAVQEHMWLRVTTVRENPYLYKTIYYIQHVDRNLLEEIRSDEGVESVECNYHVEPLKPVWPEGKERVAAATTPIVELDLRIPYEAELLCAVPPEEISFQAYEVFLALGHTVEKHSTTINKDLAPYIQRVFNFDPLEGPFYFAMNVDDDLLKVIRSDPGVLFVACDIKIHLVEGIRGGDSDPHRDIRKGWFDDL